MTDSDTAIIDYLGFDLPGENQLAQARRTALLHGLKGSAEPTSLVSYTSPELRHHNKVVKHFSRPGSDHRSGTLCVVGG